jgi:four helix bundle protein
MATARSVDELDAWKLSAGALRDRIFDATEKGPASRDFPFRDQIRDASRSAPRNLAEGFGAYMPREFARFTRIARRSLVETQNHLLDGHTRKYFTERTTAELLSLCRRALGATTKLLRYLDGCNGKPPTGWKHSTQRARMKKQGRTIGTTETTSGAPTPEPEAEPEP